jgi:hypothetical protein
MYTLLAVIRKRSEVTTEEFRHFMEVEYGPIYAAFPQTREYVRYYLADLVTDGAEESIEAIVRISFDSPPSKSPHMSPRGSGSHSRPLIAVTRMAASQPTDSSGSGTARRASASG